ncbi:MAG: DegV family protein [Pseudobutyrivibrio sp.]|nr:DegV family protein [Pseudobutyrivibrio sp.]
MSIKIITDSASDILQNQYDCVEVIPMSIAFGNQEYKDGVELSRQEFFEKMIESEELPKTSQVTPVQFEEYFRKIKTTGDEAVVITMSADLSGTYQSACIAADEFEDCITVVDSRTVCIGEHILIKKAMELISDNKTRQEIAIELEAIKDKIHVIALLDTLEYLRRGGRVSNVAGYIGEALSIKPVIAIADGGVKVLGKARGSKNGNNLLNTQVASCGGIDYESPIAVAYSGLSDAVLEKYLEDNKELWENRTAEPLIKGQIGGTIGTHAGPGAIAVAFYSE